MKPYRSARILVQGRPAGILRETDEGYEFAYHPGYIEGDAAVALSLAMPINNMVYQSKTLMPFFDGLIPEGWLLDVVAHNWKINLSDRFGLLLVSCRDCIGDVSIEEVRDED